MLRLFLLLAIHFSMTFSLFSLENFSYKSFALSNEGQLLPSTTIDVNVTLVRGITEIYNEKHYGIVTDQFSVFILEVGGGTDAIGDFSDIRVFADTRISIEVRTNQGAWVLVERRGLKDAQFFSETDEWLDASTIGNTGYIYAKRAYSASISGTSDFVTVSHDGRVGVGTDAPTAERHLDVRGNAVFGTQGTSLPLPGAFYGVTVENATDDISRDHYNINSDLEVTNDVGTNRRYLGLYSSANLFGAGNYLSENRGIQGQTDFYGSGILGLGQGLVGVFAHRADGYTMTAAGIRAGISHYGTGTIDRAYNVLTSRLNGTGLINSFIGLHIETGNYGTNNYGIIIGYSSNALPAGDWAIWQDPANTRASRLSGNLGLGINPSYRLDVSSASNPIRVQGIQSGLSSNSILSIDVNGLVKKSTGIKLGNPDTNNDGLDDIDGTTAIDSGTLRFNSATNKVQVYVSGTGWIDLH